MTQTLWAVYEKGVLRPLEPLLLEEHQQVMVTVYENQDRDWLDDEFLRYLDAPADEPVRLEDGCPIPRRSVPR